MAKKTKGLLAAAMAFAATPQGRMLLQQAKEYASRPETKQRAQQLLAQALERRKTGSTKPTRFSESVRNHDDPPQGTPTTKG